MNVYFSIYGNGASGPLFKRGPMGDALEVSQLGRVLINRSPYADLNAPPSVRYWAKSGHGTDLSVCPLMTQSGHNIRREFAHNYAPAGSVRSAPRRTLADPTPIRFTIAMAWAIVMPNGRTRSAGRYITLPDIGVGA